MKLISVIVPVYNVEKYLGECIESILSQTYENFELILVDDGSPDNSGKICDEYAEKDNRIRVIHKENGGVSSARNTGLDNAKGEYITFVDSDDIIDKQYLELMYKRIVEVDSDMCFCHFDRFDANEYEKHQEKIPKYLAVDFNDKEFIDFASAFFDLKNNVFGSIWRTIYKSSSIEKIRFNSKIRISEDLVFAMNAICNSKSICSIPNVLYHYRSNSNSAGKTYKKNFLTSQIELKKELELIFVRFDKKKCNKISQTYFCLLCYYLFSNEVKHRKSSEGYKQRIKEIKESELYKFFVLKNVVKLRSIKALVIWSVIKTKIF